MSLLVNLRMCHTSCPLASPPSTLPPTTGNSHHGREEQSHFTLCYSTYMFSYPLFISGKIQAQIPLHIYEVLPQIVQHLLLPGVKLPSPLVPIWVKFHMCSDKPWGKKVALYSLCSDQIFGSIILSTRFQHDPFKKRMLNISLSSSTFLVKLQAVMISWMLTLICQFFVATVPRS